MKEQGENNRVRKNFFSKDKSENITFSKIVQISRDQVYVIGGASPTLLARDYDVSTSCLKVDICTGEL